MPDAFAPIQEVQIGAVAYLYGILNNGTPLAITGIASFEMDSDDVTLTWDEKENKDTTGNVQNFEQVNFKYERTIKFHPSGATRAAANLLADTILGNSTFTLQNLFVSNFKIVTLNGTWRVKPGIKLSLKMADNASFDIPCEKYLNADQNANLTRAPIVG